MNGKNIVNYMWYLTDACNGDSNKLIEKFTFFAIIFKMSIIEKPKME